MTIKINHTKLKNQINKVKELRQDLSEIIQPFLSENLTNKQQIELCQIGKFVMLADRGTKLISFNDAPDFLISSDGVTIGLEHERLFNAEKVKAIKSVDKLFDDAAKLFQSKYPDHKLLANCRLNQSDFSYRKADAIGLQNVIADYIFSLVTGTGTFEKPEFIQRVSTMKHTRVSFNYSPGAHMVSYLKPERLREAILKKEPLVKGYRQNSGINQQWLLIVIGQTSPDSYEFGDYPFEMEIESEFERIYLLEDFDAKLWRIK